jgi:hypothetical protein
MPTQMKLAQYAGSQETGDWTFLFEQPPTPEWIQRLHDLWEAQRKPTEMTFDALSEISIIGSQLILKGASACNANRQLPIIRRTIEEINKQMNE